MHVYASVARVNRSDDFGELLGADLLANIATADGHDACGGDRPNKDTSPVGAILSPGPGPGFDAAWQTGCRCLRLLNRLDLSSDFSSPMRDGVHIDVGVAVAHLLSDRRDR